MNIRTKTILAATAVALAAAPASAQAVGPAQGFAAARATGQSVQGYEPDGTLNVFGARLDPVQGGGPIGGVVNGVTGVVGSTVGSVGTVVGDTLGAADAVATGAIGPRRAY